MKTLQVSQSIGVGATVNDIFTVAGQNSVFGSAANVTFYAGGRAVGLTHNMSYDDGVSGTVVLPNGTFVSIESTVGALKTNEGFLSQFAVPAGAKLILNVSNPTAGAIIYDAMAIVT